MNTYSRNFLYNSSHFKGFRLNKRENWFSERQSLWAARERSQTRLGGLYGWRKGRLMGELCRFELFAIFMVLRGSFFKIFKTLKFFS